MVGNVVRGLGWFVTSAPPKTETRSAVIRLANAGSMVQIALALVIALVAAPMVSTVTSAMDDTVGRVWPFSLEHCQWTAISKCSMQAPERITSAFPPHVRTGPL